MSILTVTLNPAIDKSSSVDVLHAGSKLRCSEPVFEPGGGGINVSRAIKALGGTSTALYARGGHTGTMLDELLEAEGVESVRVPIAGATRQNLTVTETLSGAQFRFGMPGPPLSDGEWGGILDRVSSIIPAPEYIVASGSLPPGVPSDFYRRMALIAKDRGIRLVVDASGPGLREALGPGVFMMKPNIREFSDLSGAAMDDEVRQIAAARNLIERGYARVVAVSLGMGGVLLVTEGGHRFMRSPAVPVVSRIGAGDSMVAGTVLSLTRGKSIEEAVMFGVAAGAAAVMSAGTGLCKREDTERLYGLITWTGGG